MTSAENYYLGINVGVDPSAALVKKGCVIALSEEERFLRIKHAPGRYPLFAIQQCLDDAKIDLSAVKVIVSNWDIESATDGSTQKFFDDYNTKYPVDGATRRWQDTNILSRMKSNALRSNHFQLRKRFGGIALPPLRGVRHHFAHAFQAFSQSGFEEAICLTIDGSGDTECSVIWSCRGQTIVPLYSRLMPNSLGWFYAAITEYLGFDAYDGEYKVMGLAPYGKLNADIYAKLSHVLADDLDGTGYVLDGRFVHWGDHTYSTRFTDKLPALLERPPRLESDVLEDWHKDLAFATQRLLEEKVCRMVGWAIRKTGLDRVCIGGGVGLNVKMNQAIFDLPGVRDVFCHPLCGDNGGAAGAALLACFEEEGFWPEPLNTVALGSGLTDSGIEADLKRVGVSYERLDDPCGHAAAALASGKVIGWVQGRAEAGPRALGSRSILADPRNIAARDRVNEAIKYRELWRPFCPAILAEAMPRYFERFTRGPFMVMAFRGNEHLKKDAPAIVHFDGTARVQAVEKEHHSRFHNLISSFERVTGVPVLLNTSFNLKGEPIVNSCLDALRTFYSSGLDELYIESFVVRKTL